MRVPPHPDKRSGGGSTFLLYWGPSPLVGARGLCRVTSKTGAKVQQCPPNPEGLNHSRGGAPVLLVPQEAAVVASHAISPALPGVGIHAPNPPPKHTLPSCPLLSVRGRGTRVGDGGARPHCPSSFLHTACSRSTCRPGGKNKKIKCIDTDIGQGIPVPEGGRMVAGSPYPQTLAC